MEDLRNKTSDEIFDYVLLMDVLKDYAKPRNKVTQLIKSGDIIRIKKGLYIFGDKWRKGPVCREALANLIYGPSYISLEYALAYYGLIPERVSAVTCMTTGRNRCFDTPLGRFIYHYLSLNRYSIGMDFIHVDDLHSVLIAAPEKALADQVFLQSDLKQLDEVFIYLTENMRIERSALINLDAKKMGEIREVYRNVRVDFLFQIIRGFHG